MNNFRARTITGLSMVFLMLAALFFSPVAFALIFLAVAVLGLLEFYTVMASAECHPQKITGTILGTLWYLLVTICNFQLGPVGAVFLFTAFLPFLFLPFISELYRKKEKPLQNVAMTILGLVYIALPLSLLNIMYTRENGALLHHFPAYLTSYFLITWIYDTGAYLVGITIGKHKFFERISPKKTWEGTLGGVIFAALAAVGLYYISQDIRLTDLLVLTFIIVLFGTFGDLSESLFKRSLNLKDSGNLLPGHGGILDRFDTIFVSAPFVFLYFIFEITFQY